MSKEDLCPKCGADLVFDEVDIGVGVMRGNPGCPDCGWTPEASRVIEPSDEEIYQEEKHEADK